MHRVRLLAALLAITGVSWLLPAPAAASTTYTLAGVEVNPSPATFVGSLVGQFGTWKATVLHDPLSYTGTTLITGGAFTITTFVPAGQVTGTIDGGTIMAGSALIVALAIPVTWPVVLGLGIASTFAGKFAARYVFRDQRIEKFRLREEGVTADTWDRESVGYVVAR